MRNGPRRWDAKAGADRNDRSEAQLDDAPVEAGHTLREIRCAARRYRSNERHALLFSIEGVALVDVPSVGGAAPRNAAHARSDHRDGRGRRDPVRMNVVDRVFHRPVGERQRLGRHRKILGAAGVARSRRAARTLRIVALAVCVETPALRGAAGRHSRAAS